MTDWIQLLMQVRSFMGRKSDADKVKSAYIEISELQSELYQLGRLGQGQSELARSIRDELEQKRNALVALMDETSLAEPVDLP